MAAIGSSGPISRSWHHTRSRANGANMSGAAPLFCATCTADRRTLFGSAADSLATRAYSGPLYIMQSNCGVDSLAATKAIPITMVESGPASGVWGAAELGRLIGEPNVLALDVGGTTAKCSLIEGGQVRIKTDYWIERNRQSAGYPIMVPVVDLVEIGNGGGSIAWIDDVGKLHVGPQSAGAYRDPRPMAKEARRPRQQMPISRSAASMPDISAAERSPPTCQRLLPRGPTCSADRFAGERGGTWHHPHRQQQHDQRAETCLDQSRL